MSSLNLITASTATNSTEEAYSKASYVLSLAPRHGSGKVRKRYKEEIAKLVQMSELTLPNSKKPKHLDMGSSNNTSEVFGDTDENANNQSEVTHTVLWQDYINLTQQVRSCGKFSRRIRQKHINFDDENASC